MTRITRQGLSEREYARHIGRSRGSVQKLRAAGRLVFFPDGSIDAAASDLRRAQTARRTTGVVTTPPAPDMPADCSGCGSSQSARRRRRRKRSRSASSPQQPPAPQLVIEVLRIDTLA